MAQRNEQGMVPAVTGAAKGVVDSAIGLVDHGTSSVVEIARATKDVAGQAAGGSIRVVGTVAEAGVGAVDMSLDAALDEIDVLRGRMIALLQAVGDAIGGRA